MAGLHHIATQEAILFLQLTNQKILCEYVFTPVYEGRSSEHIMASHVERLKQSRCFIETSRQIEQQKGFDKLLKPYSKGLSGNDGTRPKNSVSGILL